MEPCTKEENGIRWRCVNEIMSYCSKEPTGPVIDSKHGEKMMCINNPKTCGKNKSFSEIMKEVQE